MSENGKRIVPKATKKQPLNLTLKIITIENGSKMMKNNTHLQFI